MAAGTCRARRPRRVKGMPLRSLRDGSVATRALAVVEAPLERVAENVAVSLRVRIVTVDAGHRPEQVARAAAMGLLVAEGRDPPVGQVWRVADQGQPQAVVVARSAVPHGALERMALEAHGERGVGIECVERGKAGAPRQSRFARPGARPTDGSTTAPGPLHMRLRGAVARFAVDPQCRETRLVACQLGPVLHFDLAAVAVLAVREPPVRAEDSHRRPVSALGQPHFLCDRQPARVRTKGGAVRARHPEASDERRVAEPDVGVRGVVEGQESLGAVRMARHEALGPSSHHVPASDHPRHHKPFRGTAVPFDHEHVTPLVVHKRGDHRVGEPDRRSFEGRDHGLRTRLAARLPVGRSLPLRVLFAVAVPARLGPRELPCSLPVRGSGRLREMPDARFRPKHRGGQQTGRGQRQARARNSPASPLPLRGRLHPRTARLEQGSSRFTRNPWNGTGQHPAGDASTGCQAFGQC